MRLRDTQAKLLLLAKGGGPAFPLPTFPVLFGALSTSGAAISIPENTGAGAVLAFISATAPGDILSVGIASDPDGLLVLDRTENYELRLSWNNRLDASVRTAYTASIRVIGLGGSVTLPITITVTAATNPGQLSSTTGTALVPSIGFESRRGLGAQYSATCGALTLQGGAVLTTGVGPLGQTVLDASASGAYGIFAAPTPANSSFTFCFVSHELSKGTYIAVGLSGGHNANNYIRIKGSGTLNRLDAFEMNAVASAVTTVRPNTLGRRHINLITWDASAGLASWYVDDMTTAVKTLTVAAAGTFQFDQLFKAGTIAPVATTRHLYAAYGYNVALNQTDRIALAAWLEPERRSKFHISQSAGNDNTANCCSFDTPYKTMVGSINLADGARPGDWFVLRDGDVWVDDQVNQPSAASGISGAPIRITRSKTGAAAPELTGRYLTGAVWTHTTGDQWTTTLPVSADPRLILWAEAGSGVKGSDTEFFRLADQTNSTITGHGQYSTTVLTLTIDLGPGIDPNTQTLRVVLQPASGNGRLYTGNAQFVEVTDLILRHGYGELFFPGGSAGEVYAKRLDMSWGSNDGFDCSGSPTNVIYAYDSTIIGNGRSYGTSVGAAGEGDGCSAHGAGAYVVKRCTIRANTTGGERSEQYTTVTMEQCIVGGNIGADIVVLVQTSGGTAGVKTYRNNLIEVTAASATGIGIQCQGGMTSVAMTIENNTVVNQGAVVNAAAMSYGANVTITANRWNVIYGFSAGAIAATSSAGAAPDYNLIFGCGASPVVGVTDTHRIASDPLFASYAGRNYRLSASSPAIDAAIGSTTVVDRDGRQRPFGAANDVGCYEYAAAA